jgi:hypothetical protein
MSLIRKPSLWRRDGVHEEMYGDAVRAVGGM